VKESEATPHRRTYHLVDVETEDNTFEFAERFLVPAEGLEIRPGGVTVPHHLVVVVTVLLTFVRTKTQSVPIKLIGGGSHFSNELHMHKTVALYFTSSKLH